MLTAFRGFPAIRQDTRYLLSTYLIYGEAYMVTYILVVIIETMLGLVKMIIIHLCVSRYCFLEAKA